MGFTKNKLELKQKTTFQLVKENATRLIFITIGAMIAAFALECFLLPNHIIDGGVIGISMMVSYITKWNLGIVIFVINLPFIFLALQKMGKLFVANVLFGVTMLSIFTNIFAKYCITQDNLLATVFGGVILGVGVGLILKNDGALDGTEILAIRISKKMGFSLGQIIMFFNLFIYSAAGLLYGWDSAMLSILTYYIAYQLIDIVQEGMSASRSIIVISKYPKDIGNAIIKEFDVSVTYQKCQGGYSGKEQTMVYCVISRIEVAKMKQLIRDMDPSAFLVVQDVYEVEGVRVKKKK